MCQARVRTGMRRATPWNSSCARPHSRHDPLALDGSPPESTQRGQTLEQVGHLEAQVLHPLPTLGGQGYARPPHQRPEHGEEGDHNREDHSREPVENTDGSEECNRSRYGQYEVGEATPDVDIKGVESSARKRGELAGASGELARCGCRAPPGYAARHGRGQGGAAGALVHRSNPQRSHDEPGAQRGLGPCGAGTGHQLAPCTGQGASHKAGGQPGERTGAVPGVGARHGASHERRDGDGLDNHRASAQEASSHRAGHPPAEARQFLYQPLVDGALRGGLAWPGVIRHSRQPEQT